MADSQQVVSGQYYNYLNSPSSRYLWGCSQTVAGVWTQFLGIWLNIMLPRAVKLILRIRNLASRYISEKKVPWPGGTLAKVSSEITIESAGWRKILHTFELIRGGAHQLPDAGSSMGPKATFAEFAMGLLLLAIYVTFIVFGVLASKLAGDNTSLAASRDCDIYIPDGQRNIDHLQRVMTPYEFDAQTESAEYARRCYGQGTSSDGCDLFVQQDIPYTTIQNDSCPFRDDSMCYGGTNSAYTMTTGAVSAQLLGINTKRRYEFLRSTTCTPLNMNSTFITSKQVGNMTVYSYHYSATPSFPFTNLSWQTHTYGDFIGKGPTYSVEVFSTYQGYIPAPALDVGPTKLLTLLFILPQKIFYTNPSDDPIFATTEPGVILPPGNLTKYWMYQGGHARPLACIDTVRWRDRHNGPEWRLFRDLIRLDANGLLPGDLRLFAFSILNSHTYPSISKRLAAGLNATSRISKSTSLPLAREQWKVEATQLFETSLARASFEARNIALGLYAKYPGYVRQNVSRAMCDRTYVYQNPGWSSINGMWYLIILIPSTLIILLAFPVKEVTVEEHPVQQHPVQQHPVQQHPVQQHPVQQHPVEDHPVEEHLEQILLFEKLCCHEEGQLAYYCALLTYYLGQFVVKCAEKSFSALVFLAG